MGDDDQMKNHDADKHAGEDQDDDHDDDDDDDDEYFY